MKFLVYSSPHVKSIVWYNEHIAVAKALLKQYVKTGEYGVTPEIAKRLRRQMSHSACGKNEFCHANHWHIRMKLPGKWNSRQRYGRVDKKYWGNVVGAWAQKSKRGARWQEKNLPKKGY